LSRRPLVTWGLSVLIALVSLLAFVNLDSAVQEFGFIPAEFWRYGGATLLTSFFLHGGLLHLAGNLYFFLLLQLVGIREQLSGFSHVSALAHLGGVLAGVAAWAYWRNL
jgi:membrane associated rhomboid family serine protease